MAASTSAKPLLRSCFFFGRSFETSSPVESLNAHHSSLRRLTSSSSTRTTNRSQDSWNRRPSPEGLGGECGKRLRSRSVECSFLTLPSGPSTATRKSPSDSNEVPPGPDEYPYPATLPSADTRTSRSVNGCVIVQRI